VLCNLLAVRWAVDQRHMWVEFVVGSQGTPVFPSPQKLTFPNSNSILERTGISERVLVNSSVLRG